MKKYLILLISFILAFSSCTPDAGNNVDNESFTVTEVGDAVADAIKGSKAVMSNTQGVTAYQMSSRALPSDISIDEMLLDLMKNDAFVTAYYEAFSSVEEVESISHEFDTSEYGKSYGTMTLSASGVSGVIDASNGVNIDSISVSFDDGKDVVAITEKNVSIQIGDVTFPNRIYAEDGVSFHYGKAKEFLENECPDIFSDMEEYFKQKGHNCSHDNMVTSVAVFRQTFEKEAFWRKKGLVGVEMEAAAFSAVCKFLNLKHYAGFFCSDKHPISKDEKWVWRTEKFTEIQEKFVCDAVNYFLNK